MASAVFLRPCFLVVDREFAGSISTRKLIIETAKFNVVTAYSFAEALLTLERFPRVHGCVVSAGDDSEAEKFLLKVRETYPEIKLVLTGHSHDHCAVCDVHLLSYAPDRLLEALRGLFPADSKTASQREEELEKKAEPES